MNFGPFKISIPKHVIQLDENALPTAEKDDLFNGIVYRPDEHRLVRVPVAILPDPSFRGPKHTRYKRSFEKVNQLFIQVNLSSTICEIVDGYPHTTLVTGLADPQLEVGVSVDPFTGKFSISGTLKNLIRRQRHLILNTHTGTVCQWVFQKAYLRDNLTFNLDLLLRVQANDVLPECLVCEVKAQDGGRLIRSLRKKVNLIDGQQ